MSSIFKFDLISIFNFYIWGCIIGFFLISFEIFIEKEFFTFNKRFLIDFLISLFYSWFLVVLFIDWVLDITEKRVKVSHPMFCAVIMLIHRLKIPTRKRIITYYYDIKYTYRVKATDKKLTRYLKTSFIDINDEYSYKAYVRDRFIEIYK